MTSMWETVIGLEVHVQLNTQSKLFSRTATTFAADQNSSASIIDLAIPGTLPQINEEAIKMAVTLGIAINAQISRYTVFARKHYFYPDLPKGYQISQLDLPIVYEGHLVIEGADGKERRIGIERAHLEEDAGKSIHDRFDGLSAIDLNRAGTPLLEIVSCPDMRSPQEAVSYLKKIHGIIRALGISDGNMDEGSMRCDANVSVRQAGSSNLGTRVEIKNINSFRFVEKAIEYEAARQIDLLTNNKNFTQETRLYDQTNNTTRPMRSKEAANDYRYFPDPDLLPVIVDECLIANIEKNLPELPSAKASRYINELRIANDIALQIADDNDLACYFEQVLKVSKDAKQTANWITSVVINVIDQQHKISDFSVTPRMLGELLIRVQKNIISNTSAKTLFEYLIKEPTEDIDALIEAKGMTQISDVDVLIAMVQDIITENPEQVVQYQQANEDKRARLIGFFVGQAMKRSKGKANPKEVQNLFVQNLR